MPITELKELWEGQAKKERARIGSLSLRAAINELIDGFYESDFGTKGVDDPESKWNKAWKGACETTVAELENILKRCRD